MRGQSYLAMIGLGWTGGITLLAILSEGQPNSDNRKYFSVFSQLSTKGVEKNSDDRNIVPLKSVDNAPTGTIPHDLGSLKHGRLERVENTHQSKILHLPIQMKIISSKPKVVVEDDVGRRYTISLGKNMPENAKLLYVLRKNEIWYVVTTDGMQIATSNE